MCVCECVLERIQDNEQAQASASGGGGGGLCDFGGGDTPDTCRLASLKARGSAQLDANLLLLLLEPRSLSG